MKEWTKGQQLSLVFLLITGGSTLYLSHASKPQAAATDQQPSPSHEAAASIPDTTDSPAPCASEEACTAERLQPAAESACRAAIRQRARYDVRWDSWGRPLFIRAGWSDNTKTAITFAGDAVSFQNGFGAYEHMAYLCTIDSVTSRVSDLHVAPGRLPDSAAP